ncbi:MAG: DUF1569 domain-containing protein [Gemmatimonadetes bacterium]|nr:DUF1569 domain-containing protein [Gemmatimonadota bacterium]
MTTPTYADLFSASGLDASLRRLEALAPDTRAQWGKMDVAQMLAHLNVAYEMLYEDKHARPNPVMRALLRMFLKNKVVGPTPYPRSSPTAPQFKIADRRDFAAERGRLVAYMRRMHDEGRPRFEGRESASFGALSADEWNVMFSKHLDHHLRQFGA